MINPKDCAHENFHANVRVDRIADTEPMSFGAEVTIACVDCGTPFTFIGMPAGLSHDKPMMSFDRTEARLPIKPKDQIGHAPGMGFSVNFTGALRRADGIEPI